uniref:Tc1-like transposase DDE domain-containing protein n=1 Tax=Arion vulgaris TaxID=1028688 RepID=A0A0B7BGD8_9EUPU
MNACIFRDWLENTVLPILDKPSCIVMDNASYHNVVALEDKIPISSSTKEEMKTWLVKENVNFDNNCLKPELLQIVRQTKRMKVYQIDKIILEHGHTSLRLPPYHPQLNPIELVWAKVKGRVAEKNTTFKMCDVQNLTREAISTINKKYWRKCEDHVLREEDGYWQRDGLQFVQPTALVNILDTSESD